ncbi:MAG: hypothetical protein IJL85_01100 [Erysipelotrichaceae bacterium]|nr:hypothetical protein [Erysipelotrichaceae bacterium]
MAGNYAKAEQMYFDVPQRKGKPENVHTPKQLIVSLGVKASPAYEISRICEEAVEEAKILYDAGTRNLMVQNVRDVPMLEGSRLPTVSAMSVICKAIREALPEDCILGLSILKDHGEALVTVAETTGMDYIRPKCYVGAVVGYDGIHEGIISDVLKAKNELQSNVEIIPDIFDRTSVPLGSTTLVEAVGQAVSFGLARAVVLTGKDFLESEEMARTVRNAFPDLYLYLGGGVNPDNLKEAYDCFDGVFVSSCLKDTGNMTGKLDPDKLRTFMSTYQQILR